MHKDTLVIIPAFNEQKTIGSVISDLQKIGFTNIIVIDDGSIDNTSILANKFDVKVIKHAINLGKGSAIKTGFDYALSKNFKYIVTCDGDGQHDASDVQEIIYILANTEKSIAIGNRFGKKNSKMPFSRVLYNKIANVITFCATGLSVADSQSGLRGYKIETIKEMELRTRDFNIELEILAEIKRKNFSFVEVPIRSIYTEYSLSKGQSFFKGLQTFYELILQRFL